MNRTDDGKHVRIGTRHKSSERDVVVAHFHVLSQLIGEGLGAESLDYANRNEPGGALPVELKESVGIFARNPDASPIRCARGRR